MLIRPHLWISAPPQNIFKIPNYLPHRRASLGRYSWNLHILCGCLKYGFSEFFEHIFIVIFVAHPVATSQAVQSPSSGKEIGTRFPAGFALPSCSDAFATSCLLFFSLAQRKISLACSHFCSDCTCSDNRYLFASYAVRSEYRFHCVFVRHSICLWLCPLSVSPRKNWKTTEKTLM